ncbi:MAG: hypothetical protein SGPRY_012670 [Prymnesium sp.]
MESAEESDFVNASQNTSKVIRAAEAGGADFKDLNLHMDAVARRKSRRLSLNEEELHKVRAMDAPSPLAMRRFSMDGAIPGARKFSMDGAIPGRDRIPSMITNPLKMISRKEKERDKSPTPPTRLGAKLSEWAAEAWKVQFQYGLDKQRAAEATIAFEAENAEWFDYMRSSKVEKSYVGPRPRVRITEDDLAAMTQAALALRACQLTRCPPPPRMPKFGVRVLSGLPLHQRFVYQILLGIKRQWTWHAPRYKGQRAQTVIDLPEPPEGSRMVSAAVEEWGVGTGRRGEGEWGGLQGVARQSSVGGAVRGMGFGRS